MQIALERNVPHLACVSRVFAPLIGKVMDDKNKKKYFLQEIQSIPFRIVSDLPLQTECYFPFFLRNIL